MNYIASHGYPPAIRDICKLAGILEQAVVDNMKALEKKGYIARDRNVARGIRVLKSA